MLDDFSAVNQVEGVIHEVGIFEALTVKQATYVDSGSCRNLCGLVVEYIEPNTAAFFLVHSLKHGSVAVTNIEKRVPGERHALLEQPHVRVELIQNRFPRTEAFNEVIVPVFAVVVGSRVIAV